MASKDRTLSAEAFDKLLHWIDPNPEIAGKTYARTHRQLVSIFERAGCHPSEEFADEVMNRIARRLQSGKTDNEIRTAEPVRFILGVARMIVQFEKMRLGSSTESIDTLEAAAKETVHLQAFDPATEIENREETLRQAQCAEKCLRALSAQDRELIEQYYMEAETPDARSHKELAERHGLSPSGLRTRVMRIRKKIQRCAQKCLKNQTV